MDAILTIDSIGTILVGFGILFLLCEILVNMRGLFAILVISLIVFYFYIYLVDPSTFVIMLIIYFIGLLLIIIDGKLVNDGTLAILGLSGMILSVVLAAPNFYAGLYSVIGVILVACVSFSFLNVCK